MQSLRTVLSRILLGGVLLSGAAAHAAPPAARVADPLPHPLTLEAALAYAAANNPGLLRTREQIREQEGVFVEARAARLPSFSASGQYSRTDRELLASPMYADENWTAGITARQVVFAGGALQAQARGRREQVAAARLAFAAAVNDTLLQVRSEFYDVLLARELIGVQEEALRVLESELTNARLRRGAGTGSEFDVLRAEVSVANARPPLIRATNAYRTAQDRLRATLGAAAGDPARATELEAQGTLEVPRVGIELADALAAARAQRPELQQQEHLLKAAEQGVRAARAGHLPTVSAVGGYEWTKPSLVTAPQSHLDGWTAGLQAQWSVFDSGATAGRVRQARSRVNQARYGAEERQLAVEVEVRQAHSSLVESLELLQSSGKVVEQARESLRLAQARFQAGTATQLDVLTAQSQLTLARSNLAQAEHGHAVALASIRRAMGLPGEAGAR